MIAVLLYAGAASADPQSKSFSHWRFQGSDVTAVMTIPTREVTRLGFNTDPSQIPALWRQHLLENITVGDPASCQLSSSEVLASSPEYARTRMRWQCREPLTRVDIELNMLFDHAASHVHFANYHLPDGSRAEHLFNQAERSQQLTLTPGPDADPLPTGPVLGTYIQFGFEHILIGLDHIAFLLTLLLLGGNWRQLLLVITGFTLGHSITLSLAALGILRPDSGFIEALIGLSIALVAVENISSRNGSANSSARATAVILLALAGVNLISGGPLPTLALLGLALFCWCYLQLSNTPAQALKIRPAVTAGFGLVHGFGFASVLLEVGLPQSSVPLALLGFNLGVELGQIAIVTTLLVIGVLAKHLLRSQQALAADLLSSALCGLGVYWFLQRLYL
ncbi:MAG: HupE/UreJ family protein [Halioglobus sp.]